MQSGKIIKIAVAWLTLTLSFKTSCKSGTTIIPPPAPKKPFIKPTNAPPTIKSNFVLMLIELVYQKSLNLLFFKAETDFFIAFLKIIIYNDFIK